jgi:hypothetical protein
MKDIVAPLPKEQILLNLHPIRCCGKPTKGERNICDITHHNSPGIDA